MIDIFSFYKESRSEQHQYGKIGRTIPKVRVIETHRHHHDRIYNDIYISYIIYMIEFTRRPALAAFNLRPPQRHRSLRAATDPKTL